MDVEIWTSSYEEVDPAVIAKTLEDANWVVASVLVMDRESDRRKEWTDG